MYEQHRILENRAVVATITPFGCPCEPTQRPQRRLREVRSACWLTRSHARAIFFPAEMGLLEKALYPPSLTDNRGPPASVLRCASHGARGPYKNGYVMRITIQLSHFELCCALGGVRRRACSSRDEAEPRTVLMYTPTTTRLILYSNARHSCTSPKDHNCTILRLLEMAAACSCECSLRMAALSVS